MQDPDLPFTTEPASDALQRVVKVRRDYNRWVASETLEDYALRFTPAVAAGAAAQPEENSEQRDRLDDVRVEQQESHPDEQHGDDEGDRQDLRRVNRVRFRPAEESREEAANTVDERHEYVPTVQRHQRDQVEDE